MMHSHLLPLPPTICHDISTCIDTKNAEDRVTYRDVVVGGLAVVGVLGDGDPDLITLLSGTEDL